MRDLSNDRKFIYGVVDGQIGERSTVTFGYSYQEANTDGNMWGALVLAYSDGTQAEFDRSASTTQDWTYWDTKDQTAFVEYTYALPEDWNLKLTYNLRRHEEDDKLFFVVTSHGNRSRNRARVDRLAGVVLRRRRSASDRHHGRTANSSCSDARTRRSSA